MRVPGAVLVDIKKRTFSEGFSTITMQLARNIFPERISRDKSLVRKLKEAKVAREIEARYSKDRILELYLNQIYLGNGAYGVGDGVAALLRQAGPASSTSPRRRCSPRSPRRPSATIRETSPSAPCSDATPSSR